MTTSVPSRAAWISVILAWLGVYFAARFALPQMPPAQWARVCVALAPLAPTAFVLWFIWRSLRSLDELHLRVQLEALAIAFVLAIVLLWVLGLLELAVRLDPANWSFRHVWAFLPAFYFAGLAVAWRRYR